MQETWVRSLGREDNLEKEMATHSSILAWEFHGQWSLAGYTPWGGTHARTHARARAHTHTHTTLLLREPVPVFSMCSLRHNGRNFPVVIFIDLGATEMKVLQGHFHLLPAYGVSSHVNDFATFHFNSLLSLSCKVIIWFLSEDIHWSFGWQCPLSVKCSALRIYFIAFILLPVDFCLHVFPFLVL